MRGLTPPHLPSVAGRAVADRGPLLLSALVLVLAAVLAGAVPAATGHAADAAMAGSVSRAGDDAAVVAAVPLESEEEGGLVQRQPRSALLTDATFRNTRLVLPPELAAVLRPPVAWITSVPLGIATAAPGQSVVLAYVSGQAGDPVVTWTSGRPPGAAVPPERAEVQRQSGSAPWPVEVGLSEPAAAALHVAAGDRLDAVDERHQHVDVRVSGVYRVGDPRDPGWHAVPTLVAPSVVQAGGEAPLVTVAGLLSRDSLPDARVALDEDQLTRHVSYTPEPRRVTRTTADGVAAAAVRLQGVAGSGGGASVLPPGTRWDTRLEAVVRQAQGEVDAALAQAAALLGGLVAAAGLVLVLAAGLLARRRGTALAGARVRGATLPGLAAELGLESAALAIVALSAGVLAARTAGGQVSWAWLLPVLVAGLLAGPAAGVTAAARGASASRRPANRSARRALVRTRRLRRATLEAAVALLAVGAFVALRQRGPLHGGATGGDLLPAVWPALAAITGALLLRRLVPPAARLAVRVAARSSRALPLVAAARVAGPGAGGLSFVAVAVCAALLVVAGAVVATRDAGSAPAGDPVTAALRQLAALSAGVLAALAVLALALGAASGARERGETLARLRTLGLRAGAARRLVLAELLPPAVLAVTGGLLVGLLVARLSPELLGPPPGAAGAAAVVVPWWPAGITVLVVASLGAVAAAESSRRRRERLGLVLRVGGA